MSEMQASVSVKKSKKVKKVQEEQQVEVEAKMPEPVPVVLETVKPDEPESVVEAVAPVAPAEEELNVDVLFGKMLAQLQDFQAITKTLYSNFKILQKEVIKDRKELSKKSNKKNEKNPDAKKRTASGIAKPAPISKELSEFLGLEAGTEVARTYVVSRITSYVKENNLQNPESKRFIIPDAKLNSLLNLGEGDKLSFFNIQSHLKKHFLPATPVSGGAPVTVV
jgi:chromatin remodeling complex protein RSC6